MSQRTIPRAVTGELKRPSTRVYLALVVALAVLAAVNVYLPQTTAGPPGTAPASPPVLALASAATMLVLYGGLGLLGLALARRVGYPDVWGGDVSVAQRFVVPAVAGVLVGTVFIGLDALLSGLHPLGPLPIRRSRRRSSRRRRPPSARRSSSDCS
ncbi:hypothetical protein ACFQH6_17420 [Halobacteriaceae archaeon GCM10025711]